MARLLIVDDEVSIGDALQQVFEYEGHQVRVARDGPEALAMVEEALPDVTFLDVKMPGMDGLEALDQIRSHDPQALVVMISGHGTIDTAVEATRKGAYDFLEKPLDTDRLLVTLRNALAHLLPMGAYAVVDHAGQAYPRGVSLSFPLPTHHRSQEPRSLF